MRLTVLGASASYAGPGQACSGYLVECGDVRLMLDCGNGTLANLARVCDPVTLDAVFISHAHVDHIADLYAIQALLRYAPAGPCGALDVHLPAGLFERMQCLLGEHGAGEFSEAFAPHVLRDGGSVNVGDVTVTPRAVKHDGETFALVVSDGSRTLAYTADTAAGDEVAAAVAGADTVLAEATLPAEYAGRAPHMTAAEAARLARMADARTLVLTHLWPTTPRDAILREATEEFGDGVVLAEEMLAMDV